MAGYEVRRISEQKGRGLYATKHYKKGDIIFDELPLVSCQFAWNEGFKYEACDYCMRPLETAEQNVRRLSVKPDIVLPYPECCETNVEAIVFCERCQIKYCSIACKDAAYNSYHKSICHVRSDASHPIVQLVEAWKTMGFTNLTMQIGNSELESEIPDQENNNMNVNIYKFKPNLNQDMEDADLIISHAGAGTILEVLDMNKPLLVVINANLMDNHQIEIAEQLHINKHLYYCTCETLIDTLDTVDFSILLPYPKADTRLFYNYIDDFMGIKIKR